MPRASARRPTKELTQNVPDGMHPAIRNPLRIHSGRARKGDLQFPVQAASSCRPVCHCAIPPDAPRPFTPRASAGTANVSPLRRC
jgi:hypothetical protein